MNSQLIYTPKNIAMRNSLRFLATIPGRTVSSHISFLLLSSHLDLFWTRKSFPLQSVKTVESLKNNLAEYEKTKKNYLVEYEKNKEAYLSEAMEEALENERKMQEVLQENERRMQENERNWDKKFTEQEKEHVAKIARLEKVNVTLFNMRMTGGGPGVEEGLSGEEGAKILGGVGGGQREDRGAGKTCLLSEQNSF